jgi:hypothetical protein
MDAGARSSEMDVVDLTADGPDDHDTTTTTTTTATTAAADVAAATANISSSTATSNTPAASSAAVAASAAVVACHTGAEARPSAGESATTVRGKRPASPINDPTDGPAMDDDADAGAAADIGDGAGAAVESGDGNSTSSLFRVPLENCWLARDCTVCHKFILRASSIRTHPIVPGENDIAHALHWTLCTCDMQRA